MNINFICPINQLSYGIASTNIIHALTELGHEVALFPINPHNMEAAPKHHKSIQKALDNAKMPDFYAPCIRLYHQFDMSQFVGNGYKIGFPIFELDTFTKQEKHHLNSLDKIFICSKWAKDILWKEILYERLKKADHHERDTTYAERYILDIPHVIPLGVDTEIFYKEEENKGGPTVFFNAGKWEIRKGHDVLIEVFNRAFTEKDNVELWMMCDNIFYTKEENQQWRDLYIKSKLGSKVRFIPRVQSQEEVASIMRKTDFGIFLSRAEGWNLELLEMMACGKWCIQTDVTAHTEFCNNDNSYPIKCTQMESAFDGKWFLNQGSWWSIDEDQIEQAAQAMRNFHQMKQSGNIINEAGIETARRYSWKNTAQCIERTL